MANPQRVLEPDPQFQARKQELDRMLLAGTLSNHNGMDSMKPG